MNDVLFPWYPYKKTLIFSFLFAFCLHASFFIFISHFPNFGKAKHTSFPKLTVHLCAKVPVRSILADVHTIKPARFFPRVPPPSKKTVPKKKKITNPKAVKKHSPQKAIKHAIKKVPPEPQPVTRPQPEPFRPRQAEEAWRDQGVKSTVPVTDTHRVAASPVKQKSGSAGGQQTTSKQELAYPDYGRNPVLTYPFLARRRGLKGEVILKVLVSKTGKALRVTLEKSSSFSILDKAALRAVREWIFNPGKVNGTPVDMWVRVPVVYRLK